MENFIPPAGEPCPAIEVCQDSAERIGLITAHVRAELINAIEKLPNTAEGTQNPGREQVEAGKDIEGLASILMHAVGRLAASYCVDCPLVALRQEIQE